MSAQKEIRALVKKYFSKLKQYKYVAVLLAIGVLLLLFPSVGKSKAAAKGDGEAQEKSAYSLSDAEKELVDILSKMDGVGRADVMLTVSSDGQRVYQKDQAITYEGNRNDPESYDTQSETILINQGSGWQSAIQTQEIYPNYVGALVVCDGGGDSGTRLKVKEAVSVLTGLGTDRISVAERAD